MSNQERVNGSRGTAARSDCAKQSMSMNCHATLLTQSDTAGGIHKSALRTTVVLALAAGTFNLQSHVFRTHTHTHYSLIADGCHHVVMAAIAFPFLPQRLKLVRNVNVHELRNTEAVAFNVSVNGFTGRTHMFFHDSCRVLCLASICRRNGSAIISSLIYGLPQIHNSDRRWILELCPLVLTGWTGFGFKSRREAFWENKL